MGVISKKELTAMPKINDGRKKIIAFILIIFLSFLCVCSHSDHSCSLHTGHTEHVEGIQLSENHAESSLESGDIKTPDANRIIEAKPSSGNREKARSHPNKSWYLHSSQMPSCVCSFLLQRHCS